MDFETVLPKTCQLCYGTGTLYQGDEEHYDVITCECQYKEESNG